MIKTLTPIKIDSEKNNEHRPSIAIVNQILSYSKALNVQNTKKGKVLLNMN